MPAKHCGTSEEKKTWRKNKHRDYYQHIRDRSRSYLNSGIFASSGESLETPNDSWYLKYDVPSLLPQPYPLERLCVDDKIMAASDYRNPYGIYGKLYSLDDMEKRRGLNLHEM